MHTNGSRTPFNLFPRMVRHAFNYGSNAMEFCTMSPHETLRSTLADHPRSIAAMFTVTVLLTQLGTAAASGNCGVITGP